MPLQDIAQQAAGVGRGVGDGDGGRFFGRDRRTRPPQSHVQQSAALKCPRCDSVNTKFCYYNNYNLSQPRHFCKSCRRYWTKGGVLRDVPVGGGFRKNKRGSHKSGDMKGRIISKAHTRSFAVLPSEPPAVKTATESATYTSPVSSDAVSYNNNDTNNNRNTCYSDSQFFSFNAHPPLVAPSTAERHIPQPVITGSENLIPPPIAAGLESQAASFCADAFGRRELKGGMNQDVCRVTTEWISGGGVEEEGALIDLTAATAYWSHHQWTYSSDPPSLDFLP